jgi:hypothetical protein
MLLSDWLHFHPRATRVPLAISASPADFNEKEIFKTVMQSGPDGFPAKFYQTF